MNIFFTALATTIGAIVVFASTQILAGLIIAPAFEVRKIVGKVAVALIRAHDVLAPHDSGFLAFEQGDGVVLGKELIRLATDFWAAIVVVPSIAYRLLWIFFGIVPSIDNARA